MEPHGSEKIEGGDGCSAGEGDDNRNKRKDINPVGSGPTKRTIYINFLDVADVASNYSLRSIRTFLREQSAKIFSSLFFKEEEEEEKEVGERSRCIRNTFLRKCLFPSSHAIYSRTKITTSTYLPSFLLPRNDATKSDNNTRSNSSRETIFFIFVPRTIPPMSDCQLVESRERFPGREEIRAERWKISIASTNSRKRACPRVSTLRFHDVSITSLVQPIDRNERVQCPFHL